MRVEIIINQGQAELVPQLYLKPDAPFRYVLEIPDNDIAPIRDWLPDDSPDNLGRPIKAEPGSLQERYNQILGKMAKTRRATTVGEDLRTLQEALEERYSGR